MAKIPLGENWEHYDKLIGAKIQKKERPPIERIIDLLLTDPKLNEWLCKITFFLKENDEKPTWYGTSTYKFQHKKEASFHIKIGNGFKFRENEIFITMTVPSPVNLAQFEHYITDEMRNLLIKSATFITCNAENPCSKRLSFDFLGKHYESVCTSKFINFPLDANTTNLDEQLRLIEDFVKARIHFNNTIRRKE